MRKLLLPIFIGVVIQSVLVDSGKQRRVLFREVEPTTSDAIIRNGRGIINTGYQSRVVQQHAAAISALEEATQNVQATQLLVNNLQSSIQLQGQLHQVAPYSQPEASSSFSSFSQYQLSQPQFLFSSQFPVSSRVYLDVNVNGPLVQATDSQLYSGGIRLVDQYGNEVGSQAGHGHTQTHPGYSYPAPASAPIHSPSLKTTPPTPALTHQKQQPIPGPQNAYLPPVVAQPQQHYQNVYYQAPAQPQQQQLVHYQEPEAPQLIQLPQETPLFQKIVTPHGQIYFQQVFQQQLAPAPVVEVPAPAPVYHQVHQTLPVYQQHYNHLHLVHAAPVVYDTPPIPIVKKVVPSAPIVYDTPVPVVKKIVKEPVIITKTIVTEAPTVKLIKQPILPPAIFQKEIFAVKNPRVRVLTYSDLCTVYPYQRKLAGCVYKKAAIPELHHPDVQLIPEQSKTTSTQEKTPSTGGGVLDPRTKQTTNSDPAKLNNKSKDEALASIQDILGISRRQGLALASAESDSPEKENDSAIADDSDEQTNVAESSNKKENLVIKTTKAKVPKTAKFSIPATIKTTTTERSTTTTTRKSSFQRRSRNNKENRNQRKSKKQVPTTTEQPFRLV